MKVTIHTEFNSYGYSCYIKEHGKKGTHEDYNIAYNGRCINEYFNSRVEAFLTAVKSYVNKRELIEIEPLSDLNDHGGLFCICQPDIRENAETITIIHNSFDGREAVEWANKVLKD